MGLMQTGDVGVCMIPSVLEKKYDWCLSNDVFLGWSARMVIGWRLLDLLSEILKPSYRKSIKTGNTV